MNSLSRVYQKANEALSTMPITTLSGLWRHWVGRLDRRARATIVDSRGSVLVIKRKLYSTSWIKEKEKRMLQQALRPTTLREKHVVIRVIGNNRLLRCEREREARARTR